MEEENPIINQNSNAAPAEEGKYPPSKMFDAKGRFKIGNPGGPGNPRAKYARQMSDRNMEAAFKTCDPTRLLKAWDALLGRAELGDVQAMKLVLEFIDGPTGQRIMADRLAEIEERQAMLANATDRQVERSFRSKMENIAGANAAT